MFLSYIDGGLDLLVCLLHELLGDHDTGIVDEDVDVPHLPSHPVRHLPHRHLVTHVTLVAPGITTLYSDLSTCRSDNNMSMNIALIS